MTGPTATTAGVDGGTRISVEGKPTADSVYRLTGGEPAQPATRSASKRPRDRRRTAGLAFIGVQGADLPRMSAFGFFSRKSASVRSERAVVVNSFSSRA